MARYINEDEFIAWVKEHYCTECDNYNGVRCRACWIDDAIDLVEDAPEADVVPKSEVERLENTYRRAIRKIDNKTITAIRNAKQEVAKEIFEEIEKYKRIIIEGTKPVYTLKQRELEELKKKYTEGEK